MGEFRALTLHRPGQRPHALGVCSGGNEREHLPVNSPQLTGRQPSLRQTFVCLRRNQIHSNGKKTRKSKPLSNASAPFLPRSQRSPIQGEQSRTHKRCWSVTAAVIAIIVIVAGTCWFYRGAKGPHSNKILIKIPKQNGAKKTRSLDRRVAELEEKIGLIIGGYNELVTTVQNIQKMQNDQLAKMKEAKVAFEMIIKQVNKGDRQSPPNPSPKADKQDGKTSNVPFWLSVLSILAVCCAAYVGARISSSIFDHLTDLGKSVKFLLTRMRPKFQKTKLSKYELKAARKSKRERNRRKKNRRRRRRQKKLDRLQELKKGKQYYRIQKEREYRPIQNGCVEGTSLRERGASIANSLFSAGQTGPDSKVPSPKSRLSEHAWGLKKTNWENSKRTGKKRKPKREKKGSGKSGRKKKKTGRKRNCATGGEGVKV